jgi:hypothetical protein
MRISPSTIVTQSPHRGFTVNAGSLTPCCRNSLDAVIDRVLYMTATYPSVMAIMITFKFPQDVSYELGNSYMVRTMNSLGRYLGYNGLPFHYVWVPEISEDGGGHFHLCLLIATNRQETLYIVAGKLQEYWAGALGISHADGLVHYGTLGNGNIIRQGAPGFIQARDALIYHASYLTKTNTKSHLPPYSKGFGASQMPRANPVI